MGRAGGYLKRAHDRNIVCPQKPCEGLPPAREPRAIITWREVQRHRGNNETMGKVFWFGLSPESLAFTKVQTCAWQASTNRKTCGAETQGPGGVWDPPPPARAGLAWRSVVLPTSDYAGRDLRANKPGPQRGMGVWDSPPPVSAGLEWRCVELPHEVSAEQVWLELVCVLNK